MRVGSMFYFLREFGPRGNGAATERRQQGQPASEEDDNKEQRCGFWGDTMAHIEGANHAAETDKSDHRDPYVYERIVTSCHNLISGKACCCDRKHAFHYNKR